MTAEIAILNKSAVALAADSAVTIGEGGSAKIYNTVNKIFEVSTEQPLGIMIYGVLNYMDLPLEVIIRRYRTDYSKVMQFDTVQDCAIDFANYLEKHVPYKLDQENENVGRIIYNTIKNISDRAHSVFLNHMVNIGKFLPSKANLICQGVVGEEIKRLTAIEKADCFTTNQLFSIARKYNTIVEEIFDAQFVWLKPTNSTRNAVRRLVRLALHRAELSKFRTGIVIAGFGANEICPTLCSFEIDGIVNGKLKRSKLKKIDIDRQGSGADIRAFAQREMVERFLQGVDPSYDSYVQNRLEEAIMEFVTVIFKSQNLNKAQIKKKLDALSPVISQIRDDFVQRSEEHKDKEFRHNVLNMVQFMPKQELATLAESLIDLTSLKRRMSAERETVGGEIDVAIISKYEGFVWIKRKHYFPPNLNPRFFQRNFRPS